LLGHVGSGDTHGNTDVGSLKGGRIVDTITSYGDDHTGSLTTFDDNELLLGRGSREYDFLVVGDNVVNVLVAHILDLATVDDGGGGSATTGLGDLLDTAVHSLGDVFFGLVSFGNDTDVLGDGVGSNGVITSDHNNLDTGGSALGYGVGYSRSGRVNHTDEADKGEVVHGVVFGFSVESVSNGVVLGVQPGVAESEYSLSHTSESLVGALKVLRPRLGHLLLLAVVENISASVEDSLWGSLHDHQVLAVDVVDGELVLVGRVEGHFVDLGHRFTHGHGLATGEELGALEDTRFGGVTDAVSADDGLVHGLGAEDGSVTEDGDSAERLPGLGGEIAGGTGLIFSGIDVDDSVVEPHMGDGHSVLGKRTGLVGTDGGGGSERLDGFKILDETVLSRHTLGGQGQAHGDSGQKTFWHVGDNDTDEEDDSLEPVVSEQEGQAEEGDTQEYGDSGNDVDEMLDFAGNGRVAGFESRGERGNSTHDGVITALDYDTGGATFVTVSGEESNVLGLERVLVRVLVGSALWFGLSGKRRVVDFHSGRLDDSDVGGDSVTTFDGNDISNDEVLGVDALGDASSGDAGHIGNQVLERVHNVASFSLLKVRENTGDDDDGGQYDTQVEIIFHGVGIAARLYRVGDEAQNGTNPE